MQDQTNRHRWLAMVVSVAALLAAGTSASAAEYVDSYKGTPFVDSHHAKDAQKIPGRIEIAAYDNGGEGIAYHDVDPQNHGSGELNPANGSYLNEFRKGDGGDTSYTKFHITPDAIDDNPFDVVQPPADQLYLGWTEPGEWVNITVDVAEAGTYSGDLLYTSNRGGTISVDVNGQDATGALSVISTNDSADPVAWRQWHHWNLATSLVRLHLAKGKNVLTVHVLTGGNMNLAYLDFRKVA